MAKDWLTNINVQLLQHIGIAIAIFIIFIIFRKIFSKYIFKIIIKVAKKTPTDILTNAFLAFEKPLRVFFVVIGVYFALSSLQLAYDYNALMVKVFRSIIIILIGWGLFNLSSTSSNFFERITKRFDIQVDQILLPILSKLLRFVIVVLAIILVHFSEFNDSSLDIFLYFFTKTTAWAEYLRIKEEINLKIMEILEQENVSIAFPSRSLYLENADTEKLFSSN